MNPKPTNPICYNVDTDIDMLLFNRYRYVKIDTIPIPILKCCYLTDKIFQNRYDTDTDIKFYHLTDMIVQNLYDTNTDIKMILFNRYGIFEPIRYRYRYQNATIQPIPTCLNRYDTDIDIRTLLFNRY